MSRDSAYLLDILLHARDARMYIVGMSREEFVSDSKTYNAVIRCLEVIGEAVKRLTDEMRMAHPEIPWSRIARMRDFLIHAYDRTNLDEVWDTANNDIPVLIAALEQIVRPEETS